MRHKSGSRGTASEKAIKDIRRATRKHYSAEEKIRIVVDGLRGEETIAWCEWQKSQGFDARKPVAVFLAPSAYILVAKPSRGSLM